MDVSGAKRYQKLTQMTGACMGLLLGLIIYLFRGLISEFYTNNLEVQEETIMLFQFLAVFH
jgi:Na+-driven multidrug efflux pump